MSNVKIVFDDKVTDGNMMVRCINYAEHYLMIMDEFMDNEYEFYKEYFMYIRPSTKKVIKIIKQRFTEEGKKVQNNVMIAFNPLDLYLFFFSVKTHLDTQFDIYKDKGHFAITYYNYDEALTDREYSAGQIKKLKNMIEELVKKQIKVKDYYAVKRGKIRREKLSKEKRKEISQKAVSKRWQKR